MLVLDDVQWAEPAFLDLVEYLAGWSRDAAILVCCLARSDAELRPAWVQATTVRLGSLDRDESRLLLENLAGPLDPAAADAVGLATGGNPLFLEEMLRMLIEDGVLVERDGQLQALAELDLLRVPATVQAVLAARLDRLDAEELAVLQRAAVIGQVFWWGGVADLSPAEDVGKVAGRLQALVRKGLVRPDPRTFAGEDGFRFGHILIRDGAYDSMSKRLRGELHQRFADWVEERTGEGPELDEIIGHHLEQASLYRAEIAPGSSARELAQRASALLARAGRRALAREDPQAAVGLLERAIALAGPTALETPALELDRASALHRAGELAAAIAAFDALLTESTPTGIAASARLERAFARVASGEGSVDDVLEAAERAAEMFARLGDETGLAQAWSSVATQLFWRGLMAQMEAAADRALRHAHAAGDERHEYWALNALCVALGYGPTHADEAAERCRDLLARAEELGAAALPLFVLAGIEAMRGRFAVAWKLYERGVGCGVAGVRTGVSLYAQPLFELDPARAEGELRQTIETLDEQGIGTGRATAVAMLAEALLALGERERVTDLVGQARAPGTAEDVSTRILRLRVEARVGGDVDRAREAVALARQAESPHLLAGTLAALAELVQGAARQTALREALDLYERKGNIVGASAVRRGLDLTVQTR